MLDPQRSVRLLVAAVIMIFFPLGAFARDAVNGPGPGPVLLPGSPAPGPFAEAVLFAFDSRAFPFKNNVELHLFPATKSRLVLQPGPPGSHDETLLYYGTVIRIGDTFHLWYNGNYGPMRPLNGFEHQKCVIAYATSKDGIHWVKPELGLVEFNGSRKNNIVDFPVPTLWSTCAIVFEPEDPNPDRRFKMVYEADYDGVLKFCVAFSKDGLHWVPSAKNPFEHYLEMAGIAKHQGLYYVNGQSRGTVHHQSSGRRLVTLASADFETWSPIGAVGLDRVPDLSGPSTDDRSNQYEEVHVGAALWNRGNVLVAIYGQWHGEPVGDRRRTSIDLGLAITHDGMQFQEPIPNFRLIPAREQPGSPLDVAPALMQGQGMENVGDETFYWYSLWRGNTGSGVRLVTWPRDRLGALQPYKASGGQVISCPVQVTTDTVKLFLNASGLGDYSQIRLSLLDEGFKPIAGYSGNDAAVVTVSGLRRPIAWKNGSTLPNAGKPLRISIEFTGVRPEDARLHAVYVSASDQ